MIIRDFSAVTTVDPGGIVPADRGGSPAPPPSGGHTTTPTPIILVSNPIDTSAATSPAPSSTQPAALEVSNDLTPTWIPGVSNQVILFSGGLIALAGIIHWWGTKDP